MAIDGDVAVIDELTRRKHGWHELGAIDDRIQAAFQQADQVFRGIALAAIGFFIDARKLLFGQVAVIALELLLGAQLQPEIGDLGLATLTMLAGAIGAAIDGRFGAAPNIFAHTAVEFILSGMTL